MNQQRLIVALILAATALFLMAQRVPPRWRRVVRFLSLAVYGAAVAVALYLSAVWFIG
jgi:hypothetical protein